MNRSWDLSVIIILSLILIVIAYLIPTIPGRIVLALPFILFFPGYALVAAFFPEQNSLDFVERIALSIGLSIAIVSLIGFGLNYTPFGIRLDSILLFLTFFNTLLCAFGISRRSKIQHPFLPIDFKLLVVLATNKFKGGTKVDRVLTIVLVIAILSSIIAFTYVIVMPKEREHFTEFYILGPNGKATDYPNNLTAHQIGEVIVGISNHEYRTINYAVEVWLVNSTFADNLTQINHLYYMGNFNVTLNHIEASTEGDWTIQWQAPFNFSVPISGQFKLWFILLLDGLPYQAQPMVDLAGTSAANHLIGAINDINTYSLNLNLNVTL
jgi:uncharacterized membrane protein